MGSKQCGISASGAFRHNRLMLALLQRPLPPLKAGLAMAGAAAAVALYCLAYTALAGRRESPGEALAWVTVNLVPWFLAFELGKRASGWRGKAAVLIAALALSLAGGLAMAERPEPMFELVRRLPGLVIVFSLLVAGTIVRKPVSTGGETAALAPAEIDWVAAAGNYVELHSGGRTTLRRMPLAQVEAALSSHDFVRIHRSILVRRDRIARIRPRDVLLHDGTSLRTGSRYRARLHG